jgi:hypothetical protein
MARKAEPTGRFSIDEIPTGWVVLDNDQSQNMRVRGPFDGPTGRKVAAEARDKLEREAEAKRARGAR